MKGILANFTIENIGTYTTVIVVFTYNILLDVDMGSRHEQWQKLQCILYMTLPFFTLIVLIICMDKTFRGVLRFICPCKCDELGRCRFYWLLVLRILKAVLVGLLWVITLLIDGDWYVCCKNNWTKQQSQLAYGFKWYHSDEEQVIIADLKSESKLYGFSTLFGVICLAAIMSVFDWRKCCKGCCKGKSDCCERETLYDRLIIEEEENVLKEILREKAKEELTKKIKEKFENGALGECFDVGSEIIKARPAGRISTTPGTCETARTSATPRTRETVEGIELGLLMTGFCSSGTVFCEESIEIYAHGYKACIYRE
ncbi:uncharacterized protein LOC113145111 isoform X2 [Mastacembelus armatus]|uniref:uncharacterized protein LOC113145111 isoform X2 n=1 Tax=Mastacembelus armatus TaxID=205130 RepID=UPI000E462728|nr:uncharacterized protein LOC113145111 isoform X2 [Mastacembelus armatus]